MKKKLNEIKVTSFVTELTNQEKVKGGTSSQTGAWSIGCTWEWFNCPEDNSDVCGGISILGFTCGGGGEGENHPVTIEDD